MVDRLAVSRSISAACDRIEAGDRKVEISQDFVSIHSELKRSAKGRVTPECDWLNHDMTRGNSLCITIRNKADGELDAFCQARFHDLRDESFADFTFRQFQRLYGNGEPVLAADGFAPRLHEISNRVVHVGDYYLWPRARRRPHINPSDLATLIYGLCLLEFDPDWMVAFIKNSSNRRGLSALYIMPEVYTHAVTWAKPTKGRRDDDVLLCINKREIHRIFEVSNKTDFEPISANALALSR